MQPDKVFRSPAVRRALRAISQGKTLRDGSVEVSSNELKNLEKKGLARKNEDGSYDLTVDKKELAKHIKPTGALNRTAVATRLVAKDSISQAKTVTSKLYEGLFTSKVDSTIKSTPASPATGTGNPYLMPGETALVRSSLTTIFALQIEIGKKMQESRLEMTELMAKSAMSQIRAINVQSQGEQLKLLASASASTSAGISLLGGALSSFVAKTKQLQHSQEARDLELNPGKRSAVGQVLQEEEAKPKATIKDGILTRERPGSLSVELRNNLEQKESKSDIAQRLKDDQINSDKGLANTHKDLATFYGGASNVFLAIGRAQENLAMLVKDSTSIVAEKQISAGKMMETLSQSLEKMSDKGHSDSTTNVKQAFDQAQQLLQLIGTQAQTESESARRIFKG